MSYLYLMILIFLYTLLYKGERRFHDWIDKYDFELDINGYREKSSPTVESL